MSELDISIITIFKQYYPNIDHTTIERNTLANMIDEMFEIEKSKYSDSESESEYFDFSISNISSIMVANVFLSIVVWSIFG